MKRFVNNLIGIITGILFLNIIFFTSIQIIAYNDAYYSWHYSHYNIMEDTNIEKEDLMFITDEMIAFLKGQRHDLVIPLGVGNEEVFGEREKLHMEDVQILFLQGHKIRNYSLILFITIILLSILLKKKMLAILMRWIQYVIGGFISIIVVLSIIISTNFNYFFTVFHELFFDNDLWLLDPRTDLLINMVPLQFFINTSLLIGIVFLIMSIISIILIYSIRKSEWLIKNT
ncbi:integral membrane protein (TIGR01906 family) [Natranaerovirga pectinivora]|uniref:Integral membrane protein (TIGR01906 family) n=1 Tax=Natranaerovirga pectinivora TaxID=682400 RepID=A0A4V2V0L8_9FIRM|nr:TIGR01906 family membrane protein [Natranaerovirga pectinivora]TCT16839.1 integral membrane protein (TIGR01906 family) [Natranaerovirga pectinivora]